MGTQSQGHPGLVEEAWLAETPQLSALGHTAAPPPVPPPAPPGPQSQVSRQLSWHLPGVSVVPAEPWARLFCSGSVEGWEGALPPKPLGGRCSSPGSPAEVTAGSLPTCHTPVGQQGAWGPECTPSGWPVPVSWGECRRAAGLLKEKLEREGRREGEREPRRVTLPHPNLHHQDWVSLDLGMRQLGAQGLGSPHGRVWAPRLRPGASGCSRLPRDSSGPGLQGDARGRERPPPPGSAPPTQPRSEARSPVQVTALCTNSLCASRAFPEPVSLKICTV